ncbi:Activin_recp domain-containing protein [Caenorhabditis elegans]|uniref:Activin_recp domain-containing protein n=1 Tax=Caenorhabditis elegans TaxID=6239 RepID=E4MVC5_CAEEL|nr:Activin types I and II receptor domain-containing protein [Caenorhabditis elegans]CCD67619.1 Activin types I and II receptor domain-containing protein [Caenorhabditis elegans]|eukprot:NP_001250131.1 Uncharacterized protein CELE_T08B2.15 [Caenorhabditis elegans]
MWSFVLCLLICFEYSYQWREYKAFECYHISEPVENILNGQFNLERQKCYGTEGSSLFNACKTDIIDGIVYSGCMNTTHWRTNFLCSPTSNKREFINNLDTNGIFIFDEIKSCCCRDTLCNNANYLKVMKNKYSSTKSIFLIN